MRRWSPMALAAALALALAVGVAAVVVRAEDLVEIPLTIEKHRFQPEVVRVKANAAFVLVVTNNDPTPEEFESRELKVEKVIPGGKTLKIRMRALKPGTYPFVGEFHEATAKGRIVAE